MSVFVKSLFHYPIKGLKAQSLSSVALTKGQGFPLDRAFGFALPESGFDPKNPKPLPKTKFVMLAKNEGLALLDTHFDQETQILSIKVAEKTQCFDISINRGRKDASSFISDQLGLLRDKKPTLYSAEPHKFTDVSVISPEMMNSVSLINIDSVEFFSESIGNFVDPGRFRCNILFTGMEPLRELGLVGKQIRIGEVEMEVVLRTKRCAATEVNLISGERDLNIPALLKKHYGHSDMGIYAEVKNNGTINEGDEIILMD